MTGASGAGRARGGPAGSAAAASAAPAPTALLAAVAAVATAVAGNQKRQRAEMTNLIGEGTPDQLPWEQVRRSSAPPAPPRFRPRVNEDVPEDGDSDKADDNEEDDYEDLEEEPDLDMDPEEMVFGSRVPFQELGIEDEDLLGALEDLGFRGSTRVQAATIPMILQPDRRAVVINSETGSGKTLAYLVPAFELALKSKPRKKNSVCPKALILVPGRELGYQVKMVAQQLANALKRRGREISVVSSRSSWPFKAPDILIATPRAAAQGLIPAADETDEVTRRKALERILDTDMVVFDEADMLLGGGSQTADVRAVLVALSASYPLKPREVLPEAQVYYAGGVPVEILNEHTLEWRTGHAMANTDGTFNIRYAPGDWDRYVSRSRLRGPGIALLVENGPRIVLAAATLPSYKRSRWMHHDINTNRLYNGGIGSPDWVIKRWFPNAVRVQSEWIHRRHPCIVQQDWIEIEGENRAAEERNLGLRIEKTVDLIREQGSEVRTLVFANSPDACLACQVALKAEGVEAAGIHAGLAFPDRLEGLKRFMRGEISVLICSDLAARGLDLPICRHVIQMEFAKNPTDHLHRVGRAARAGRLSKTTNLWGDGDYAVRETVLQAPKMGLDGDIVRRAGNCARMRRIRKKQRRQEFAYGEVRRQARMARYRTQSKKE